MNISKLNKGEKSRDISLDFGDAGKVAMTVLPKKFTIGLQRQLKRALDEGDLSKVADNFFSIVQGWDLEGEDGKPLPLTPEGLDQLEVETFGAIATKMMEQIAPS